MPSESSFKEKITSYRRQLESSDDPDSLLRTFNDMRNYIERFPDDSNRKICAAHLGKELVDWIAQKQDDVLEAEPGKCLLIVLEQIFAVCHTAQDAIRSFCVARLYNAVITLNSKSNGHLLRLRVCGLMSHFPIEDEQVQLFDRLKRVVLKTIQDCSSKGASKDDGIDLIIALQRKLLEHAAGKPPGANGTRSAVLVLFREMFDTSLAMLYRVFTVCRPKAHQFFRIIMDTMETKVRPCEAELISLLSDSIGFLETIISFSGEDGEYLKFAKFLSIFAGINREPYASCYLLLYQQLQFQQQANPSNRDLGNLTNRVRTLHAEHTSNSLVVKVAIFLTCQASIFFNRLPQDVTLTHSGAAIEFFQSLLPFVRHCPPGNVAELCRMCTSSRRHLAERLITIIVQLCIFQVKDASERRPSGAQENAIYPTDRVCELLMKKFSLLEQLECERKRSLIDNTVRQCVTWMKCALTILRNDPKSAEDANEVLKLLKLLIATQNSHRFEFLTDLHLVRLLENCYIERTDHTSAQASAFCWGSVSVRLLKLLLTLRESACAVTEEEQSAAAIAAIIRSIMFSQINAPDGDPIRSLGTVQLYQHHFFDRHGFVFDCVPNRVETFRILSKEMALAVKYKTPLSCTPWDYFQEMQKVGDLRENCLTFGMALYGFSENDAERIPTETMNGLCDELVKYKPTNIQERIKRSASLGMGSYLSFCLLSRATLNRMRDIPFKIEHLRNDQIDELLVESQLDRETKLIESMEAISEHYGEMLAALAQDSFRSLTILPSVVQIASILDNIARYYQLNYYPHRAVELQIQNLLLVSQGREDRPLEQCGPLGFLLEQHCQTEELLSRFETEAKSCWQTCVVSKLGSLEGLAKRARNLLEHFSISVERFDENVPENRKYPFLNLYLGLAIYHASRGELDESLELIRRILATLPQTESCAYSEGQDDVKPPMSPIETVGLLLKGRIAQIIFRMVVEYGLSWPGTDSGVCPVSTFLKSMLTTFNDLQRLPNKHTFVVSLATVEMTVAVLQYLIVRYDTGALIEPYVDQLLKFVLRRGAGLRLLQVLLLYGQMSADMQKLDRCEISIRYLYRLLMLRPVAKSPTKNNAKMIEGYMPSNEKFTNAHHRHWLPVVSPIGTDSDCDGERKAAPKHSESTVSSAEGITSVVSDSESMEPTIEQYLMFQHATKCDCCYCLHPQYKLMAFQTGALSARLSALKRSHATKRTEHSYRTIETHWLTVIEPASERSAVWYAAGYRKDLLTAVIRMFVQWGQYLGMLRCFERAMKAYDRAFELCEKAVLQVCIDPALLEDVGFHRATINIAQKRADCRQPIRRKITRSVLEKNFQHAIGAAHIASTGSVPPVVGDMASLNTELNKLFLTPKQQPASASQGKCRAPPKTVDRVNELIRQAATRRHQLKKIAPDEPMVSTAAVLPTRPYSASARKPKTVNIFVDSPPGAPPGQKIPRTVGKLKIAAPSTEMIAPERILTEDTHVPATIEGRTGTDRRRRLGEKRALLQGDTVTPVKSMTNTFKATLMNVPAAGTLEKRTREEEKGKLGRFEINDFPSLSKSNEAEVRAPQTPQRKAGEQVNTEFASPGLNGSFRDALVLGGRTNSNSSNIIVLDDSTESGQSEEAVEASFIDNVAMSTGNNSALSLRSYSDRKRLLQGSGSDLTPSARSAASVKRRTPLVVSKTKLRFDDPSPEHVADIQPTSKMPVRLEEADKRTPQKVVDQCISKGFVSARKNARKRTCQPARNDEPMPSICDIPSNKTVTNGDNIATRTRQRRKRM